jgi:hypothetical protein
MEPWNLPGLQADAARKGAVVEIVGRVSSGRTSLLHAWLAHATGDGAAAALIDVDDTFDAPSALRAGVDLRRLLWVQTGGRRDHALAALGLLLRCPGFAVVAVDAGERPPRLTATAAFRFKRALRGSVLIVAGRRRVMGAAADLAVETVQDGCEWTGAGFRARRLAAVCTTLELLRPGAARHPRAASVRWPGRARWTA